MVTLPGTATAGELLHAWAWAYSRTAPVCGLADEPLEDTFGILSSFWHATVFGPICLSSIDYDTSEPKAAPFLHSELSASESASRSKLSELQQQEAQHAINVEDCLTPTTPMQCRP